MTNTEHPHGDGMPPAVLTVYSAGLPSGRGVQAGHLLIQSFGHVAVSGGRRPLHPHRALSSSNGSTSDVGLPVELAGARSVCPGVLSGGVRG
jgi:hypothetical protein